MAISSQRARPGPKPKGVRRQLTIRILEDQFAIYQDIADRAGLPVSDYIAYVLAHHHNLPTPEYVLLKRGEEEMLPLLATG
ncbi:MAG: hypothetical protein WA962_05605 [Ornithinimicrobium sp.]